MRVLAAVALTALASCSSSTPSPPNAPKWTTGSWERACRYDAAVLPELSGLAPSQLHANVLWALNDSGNAPVLVALDTTTCTVRAQATVSAPNTDWEGLASGTRKGRPVLFIGDTGNNARNRSVVTVIEVPEPALGTTTVSAKAHPVTLPDGPVDAEGIMARGTKVWIVTKQFSGSILRVNLKKGRASEVASAPSFATDASLSPGADVYAIRDYPSIHLYRGLPPGDRVGRSTPPQQPQAEAVAFSGDGTWLYTASEQDRRVLRAPVVVQ